MNALFSQAERQLAALPIPVQLILPDGTKLGADNPKVGFQFKSLRSLSHLVRGKIGAIGEDYVEGRVDIRGSMRDLMTAAAALLKDSPIDRSRPGFFTEMARKAASVMRHTLERDARQIEFHYDLSDEFYGLWQDPRRVYSCAYYRDSNMTLAQAQEAKLDHICRKLRLQKGERFLDIGAGWGGLLLWAAENYGVDATGITLSKNQYAHVNRLIEEKDKDKRELLARAFKADLKNRIDETHKYIRPSENTMEYAFMFIPSEAIYYDLLINKVGATNTSARDLIEYAFREKNVIIVSPTTFMAYLQTVLQGLRSLQIEEQAKEIQKRVGELGRHIRTYEELMQKLGNSLGTTVGHFNNAHKELKKVDKDVVKIAAVNPVVEPLVLDKPVLDQD